MTCSIPITIGENGIAENAKGREQATEGEYMVIENDTQTLVLARVREIDRMDEEQIIQEIAGEAVKEYIYEFPMDGKTVRGLSWVGYKELAWRRGNIQIGKPLIEDGGDHWRCLVEATDLARNVTFWAGTHQPKMRRINNREGAGYRETRDDFAIEKAISKAQRNVLKNLIPHTIQMAAIEAIAGGKTMPTARRSTPKTAQRREALPQAIMPTEIKTLAELWNAGLALGYRNKAEIMGALNVREDSQISDFGEALATLRILKQGGTPLESPAKDAIELTAEMERDAKELF